MIFWDLDGPILDVSKKYYTLYKNILLENNMQALSKKEYWNLKKSKTTLSAILAKTNSEKLLEVFKNLWLNNIETHKYQKLDKLQNGIISILKKCNNTLVLVTLRKNRVRLLEQLDELELKSYFETILSSGENIQPRWKIKYNLINDYLEGEIANHHMMIGDTETDILAGNYLGFTTIGVLCGIRDRKLIDSKPDKILNHTSELMEHIF